MANAHCPACYQQDRAEYYEALGRWHLARARGHLQIALFALLFAVILAGLAAGVLLAQAGR